MAAKKRSTKAKATKAKRATAAPRGKKAPRRAAKKASARPAAKGAASGGGAARELTALKARFQREKSALEKRLTDTVREIGQLRHHETRAAQLERQLKERDETIGQLRTQLSELRNRPLASREDDDAQPSLALGSRGHGLDDYDDDDIEPEEDDELI